MPVNSTAIWFEFMPISFSIVCGVPYLFRLWMWLWPLRYRCTPHTLASRLNPSHMTLKQKEWQQKKCKAYWSPEDACTPWGPPRTPCTYAAPWSEKNFHNTALQMTRKSQKYWPILHLQFCSVVGAKSPFSLPQPSPMKATLLALLLVLVAAGAPWRHPNACRLNLKNAVTASPLCCFSLPPLCAPTHIHIYTSTRFSPHLGCAQAQHYSRLE